MPRLERQGRLIRLHRRTRLGVAAVFLLSIPVALGQPTTVTVFTDPSEPALGQQPLWFVMGLATTLLAALGWRLSRSAAGLRRSAA
jgi:hypothetical protein